MKKLIYGMLFLALVGVGLVRCKKEVKPNTISSTHKQINESSNKKNNVSFRSDGRMLIFNTSDDFASFIEFDFTDYEANFDDKSKENQLIPRDIKSELSSQNYVRYSDYIATSNEVDYIDDPYLNEILNKDKIVQIGNFIYRINKETEKVYVLSADLKSDYNSLINEDVSNTNIKVYSTEEDVIEMVESGKISSKGIFCNSRSAFEKSKSTLSAVINQYASMYTTARYKKYGLSWKLEADVILYNTDAASNLKVYIAMDKCRYKQRCGTSLTNFSHPWLSTQVFPLGTFYKIHRYTLYNSVKKLENYTFTIRGRVEDLKYPYSPSNYNVVFTDWVSISDY